MDQRTPTAVEFTDLFDGMGLDPELLKKALSRMKWVAGDEDACLDGARNVAGFLRTVFPQCRWDIRITRRGNGDYRLRAAWPGLDGAPSMVKVMRVMEVMAGAEARGASERVEYFQAAFFRVQDAKVRYRAPTARDEAWHQARQARQLAQGRREAARALDRALGPAPRRGGSGPRL